MAWIEKRSAGYRVHCDPLGRAAAVHVPTQGDADRRGKSKSKTAASDRPRAPVPLTGWVKTFLRRAIARPTTRSLPATLTVHLAAIWCHRIGRLKAGHRGGRLNDEIDAGLASSSVHRHYRTPDGSCRQPSKDRPATPTIALTRQDRRATW